MENLNMLTAMLAALAFALAPVVDGAPHPDGGPTWLSSTARANANTEASSANPESTEGEQLPVITIYSTDNVTRGKTGSFVLDMKPAPMLSGMYVNFSVGGTAVQGVDYVALVSPAYIGQSGYGVIQIKTLPDSRGSSLRQAYSVVITLEDGAGYSVGKPGSATMWIKP
jgi:hypothetical protein